MSLQAQVQQKSRDWLKDYEPVADRIKRFLEVCPEGRIITRLVSPENDFQQCRYRAEIYESAEMLERGCPLATGHAVGIQGQGFTGGTAWEETAETSAIGRALANAGFGGGKERPSLEEMLKARGNAEKGGE